jgi:O-antigen/teichoic acid export membrane protein
LVGVGKVYIIEGILSIVFGIVLTRSYGVEGMAAALVLAISCASAWYMPWTTWRMFHRIRTPGDPDDVQEPG